MLRKNSCEMINGLIKLLIDWISTSSRSDETHFFSHNLFAIFSSIFLSINTISKQSLFKGTHLVFWKYGFISVLPTDQGLCSQLQMLSSVTMVGLIYCSCHVNIFQQNSQETTWNQAQHILLYMFYINVNVNAIVCVFVFVFKYCLCLCLGSQIPWVTQQMFFREGSPYGWDIFDQVFFSLRFSLWWSDWFWAKIWCNLLKLM